MSEEHKEEHKEGHGYHSHESHKKQEEHKESHECKKEFNYWYIVTGVLVLLLVASFFTNGFSRRC